MNNTFIRNIILMALFSFLIFESSVAGVLVYSTYLGGNHDERVNAIAIDSSGNVYLTGYTFSDNFPATPGVFQSARIGQGDIFVTKLNPSGTALVYSTLLGGEGSEEGTAIAIDSVGNACITGYTNTSTDFPITAGAFDTSFNGGFEEAVVFVTKFNTSGTALVYSTFLGIGLGYGIAVDSSGNAYITGVAGSSFPTTSSAFDTSYNGNGDVFVTKLNSSGTALVYSTFLGGGNEDHCTGIVLDSLGNTYITGYTASTNFPTILNAFDTSSNGGDSDVFVSKLNPSGTGLIYSTYLGSGGNEISYGITVDNWGNAYLTGWTNSPDFPITTGAFDTSYNGASSDGFVTKVDSSGTALVYSTYLGGASNESGTGIAVDDSENAYLVGETYSSNFPTTLGAFDTSYNGTGDVFVSKLNPSGSTLLYSTYLGGGDYDMFPRIVMDKEKNTYITGYTWSTDFPTTPGALHTLSNGRVDIFITKFSGTSIPVELIDFQATIENQDAVWKK